MAKPCIFNSWSTIELAIAHAWSEVDYSSNTTALQWRSVASTFNAQYPHFSLQTTWGKRVYRCKLPSFNCIYSTINSNIKWSDHEPWVLDQLSLHTPCAASRGMRLKGIGSKMLYSVYRLVSYFWCLLTSLEDERTCAERRTTWQLSWGVVSLNSKDAQCTSVTRRTHCKNKVVVLTAAWLP